MREIKFRAWDKKNKKMFIPLELDQSSKNDKVYMIRDNFLSLRDIKKESIVLMQYTGLGDENRKECWDGDLLLIDGYRIVKIVWQEYAGCWDTDFIKDIEKKQLPFRGIKNNEWQYRAKKIGNIYENSELLK